MLSSEAPFVHNAFEIDCFAGSKKEELEFGLGFDNIRKLVVFQEFVEELAPSVGRNGERAFEHLLQQQFGPVLLRVFEEVVPNASL